MAKVMADMGFKVTDGKLEKAPEAPTPTRELGMPDFTTMGEHARFNAEKKATPPPAETPPAGAVTPPAETPPAPTPPPAKAKVEVEKGKPIEEIVEGVIKRLQKPSEAPAAPAATAPKAPPSDDPDASYIEALDEDQREEIDLARYAAKAMPDKYGNMAKKTVDYLKKVDDFIAAKQKEDPDWDPQQDESFSAFVQENRPSYQSGDRKKLQRSMIATEVRAEVESEIKPKLERIDRTARIQELKPEVDKAVGSYQQAVAEAFTTDDKSPFHPIISKAIEGGMTDDAWKEAKKVDAMAVNIVRPIMERAVTMGKTVLDLVSGIGQQVPFNPSLSVDHPNNVEALKQAKLFSFIDTQENLFNQNGGNLKVANGRSFLPRRDFYKLSEAEQAKHWTLTPEDILGILRDDAVFQAKSALDAEIKRREEEGYARNGGKSVTKTETAATPPPPAPAASPRATVTASPGAANLPPPASPPVLMPKEYLDKILTPGRKEWA